jgi:phosphoribosylamine-glycine ligase
VFDDASHGKIADAMREETPVIGSSAFAERLEEDRLFGIEFMERCGINVPEYEAFDDVGKATKWLKKTGKRCVFKPSGSVDDKSITYCSKSADDMEDYLIKLTSKTKVKEFILQEFVSGTEVSTNAWFNGNEFVALDHTLEEKKFLSGGLGPNTGCAGNVVWMPQWDHLFAEGLYKTRTSLAEEGFTGPIDLNTIATEGKLFGLEWTPRFGYEGTCNLIRLLPMEFGEFLHGVATGQNMELASKHNFSATIRISVPPYPNPSTPKKYGGVPVKGIEPKHLDCFYLADVMINDAGEMETLGMDGFIGCPIGCSDTIKGAFDECEAAIRHLQVPDLQWRSDIRKCCERRYEELNKNGWLKRVGALT